MRLDYNILWFEDDKAAFDTKKRRVKTIIETLGFNFPEPRNEVDSANIATIDYDIYDLIIADLNLEGGSKGSNILEFIRDKEIYTEVVFYSSEGESYVRAELAKLGIDGAYCANRTDDDFVEKVEKVIRTTIKKVQDLNNIRGLIMSETSDIDRKMKDVVNSVIDKDFLSLRGELIEFIFRSVESKVNEKKDKFDKYKRNRRIDKVITDSVMFDAFEKIKALQFIFERINIHKLMLYKNNGFSNGYAAVTNKRNLLAHETPRVEDGKKMIGSGTSAFEFNDDFCIDIRKKVKGYGDNLDHLLEQINLD